MKITLRTISSYCLWPLLLSLAIAATALGFYDGNVVLGFNLTYSALAVVLLALERLMPHEPSWTKSDGQLLPDILHTLVSKGAVQTLIVFSAAIGLTGYITPLSHPGYGIWPRHWPLAAQILLAVTAAEFAFYWAHRLAHEWKPLWPYHAVHHSVIKLWVMNTGRFHFIDSLKSIVPGVLLLAALGAPLEVISWLSAITAYIGLLTHCNIELRFGVLSAVFNTPALHRWHHSKRLREGNKNYGENIMLWDHVFGTWFNEPHRRPPKAIGITDTMPQQFWAQLLWPFRRSLGRL